MMPRSINPSFLLHRFNGLLMAQLIFCLLILTCPAAAETNVPPAPPTSTTKESAIPDMQALDFKLSKQLVDLQSALNSTLPPDKLHAIIPETENSLEQLNQEINLSKTAFDVADDSLNFYEVQLQQLQRRLDRESSPQRTLLRQLVQWHIDWSQQKKAIAEGTERMKEYDAQLLLQGDIQKAQQVVDTALTLIATRMGPTKKLLDEVDTLQVKLYGQVVALQETIETHRRNSLLQATDPIYSKSFHTDLNNSLVAKSWKFLLLAGKQQLDILTQNITTYVVLVLSILFLWALIRYSAHHVESSNPWHAFSRKPLNSAIFLCTFLYLLSFRRFDFPGALSGMLQLIMVFNLLSIGEHLLATTWNRKFFTRTIMFLAITLLLHMIHLPGPLFRIYIILASGFSLFFCLYLTWSIRQKSFWHKLLFLLTALLSLGILLAEILGYGEYGKFIFIALLKTLVAALSTWILMQMVGGLIGVSLQFIKSPFIQRNNKAMVRDILPLLITGAAFFLVIYLLQIWSLRPLTPENLDDLFQAGFSIFSLKISVGFVLSMAMILYTTTIFSRWSQKALLEVVMPKYNMDRGVQLSFARIVQYMIFLLGFFLVLRTLGVEMTQLAILGGALGVGIGFGLQAIVNNFISGLILLFERPIKVGDVILVGQETGEVSSLGLRATVVRTYDNAEIVIPNANLITGQVTNWTLKERRIRVRVTVGVAYGSDTAKVIEILLGVADGNPLVLSNPKPVALFLAFGPSSLDFELRVWIPEVDDIALARSELNLEIESEFRSAGISIPFPQTDLHLRSVDPDAAKILNITPADQKEKRPHETEDRDAK